MFLNEDLFLHWPLARYAAAAFKMLHPNFYAGHDEACGTQKVAAATPCFECHRREYASEVS